MKLSFSVVITISLCFTNNSYNLNTKNQIRRLDQLRVVLRPRYGQNVNQQADHPWTIM